MEPKHSALGITSFVISLVVGFLMLATFIAAGVLHQGHSGRGHPYPGQTLVGLAILGLLGIDIVAVVLGIVSLFQQGRKRLFGILGVAFSALTLLITLGLMILGLMLVRGAR